MQIKKANRFVKIYEKSNRDTRNKIDKMIARLIANPEDGKPMRFGRKGTRELPRGPFRLSYEYFEEKDEMWILDFYHKDEQ